MPKAHKHRQEMKKLILIFLTALTVLGAPAQESFKNKFNNVKGITSVYISKALLGMMPDTNSAGLNLGPVAKKLDNIQIFNSETKAASNTLKKGCLNILANENYENLMNVNEDDEHNSIYMKQFAGGMKQYVLLNVEKDEINVIVLTGKLTIEDIRKITGQ